MSNREDDFRQLLELGQAMLSHAEEQAWDKVMIIEARRRQCLEVLFADPVSPDEAEAVAKIIQDSLLIDQKIKELGEIARFNILQTLQEMEQGKKAIKAYTS